MDFSSDTLHEIFSALSAHLEARGLSIAIVVVGGASLAANNLVDRTTKDVDVIATAERTDGKDILHKASPFSPEFQAAIDTIARDYQLPGDWLNAVIDKQWKFGLPNELYVDIEWREYGALSVGYVGRTGLIPLKLFAVIDQGHNSKHWQDLIALSPNKEELASAAKWVRSQDAGQHFADFVDQALEELNHELARNRN